MGCIQLEAFKAVTSVALPHAHTAAILTAIQDATFLSLKSFEGGQWFWERVRKNNAEACA